MSDQSDLSFGTVVRSVWGGVVDVFQLRFLLLGSFLVFLAIGRALSSWAADNAVLQVALDVLQTILFLPVEIAIYRLLILGEVSSSAWASSAPRMQRMVGWTVVLWVLMTLPKYLSDLTQYMAVNIIATTAVVLVIIVLLVRLAILFPAIAVDASGASFGNVWADTKGRIWLILKTYVIVLLPPLAGVVVVGLISDGVGVPAWFDSTRDHSFEFLANIALAVASARLFGWIGHHVKGRPAGPAGSPQLAGDTPSAG